MMVQVSTWRRILGMACGLALVGRPAVAQDRIAASVLERGSAEHRAADTLLARRVSIDVTRVPLHAAIDAVATSARVEVSYEAETVNAHAGVVTVKLANVTLGDALGRILAGTGLEVAVAHSTQLVIVSSNSSSRRAVATGAIAGQVIDAKTKRGIMGASVTLDSSQTMRTNEEGRYRFARVDAGTHRMMIRSVGYRRESRVVTVADGETKTVDFALESGVNTLDQVVVTATGLQRYRELGHVVSQINADSLVKEAPITNLGELLQSRVPGLQVLTGGGGIAGGAIQLRLRGQTSVNLNSEPVVIVDGVRYKSNNSYASGEFISVDNPPLASEPRSPLNDLNVNDIETVEVVKGPSASTLYGPDAANGVIVITTKHGKPGKTQFNWYARPVSNDIPKDRIARGYQAWGHDSSGALYAGNCTVLYQYKYGLCILDSITVAQTVVDNSAYSVIAKSRPTWQYGASLSGGVQAFRYFFSGNYDSQTGILQVPTVAQDYLKAKLGVTSLSDAIQNPNTLQTVGLRSNLSADLTDNGSVAVSLGYVQTNHRSTNYGGAFSSQYGLGAVAPGMDTSDVGTLFYDPPFLQTSNEHANRFTGDMTGTLRLTSWLSVNALAGIDIDGSVFHSIVPAGELDPSDGGLAEDDRRDNTNRTITLGAVALSKPGRLSFRSSLVAQYTYSHLDGVSTAGSNLAPGSTSIGTAQSLTVSPLWDETVSLGTAGEEVVGLNDRLFVTGSLRIDGSTSFGEAYHPTPYPKIGVSWIASEEPWLQNVPGMRELRFRYSFGAASRYPTSGMKVGSVQGSLLNFNGDPENIFIRTTLANPLLRLERSREMEYGADATLIGQIQVGLSWYKRRTTDQLQQLANPTGLLPIWRNVASVAAHGFEATVNIPVLDTHGIQADLTFTHAFNTDKVLSLGDAQPSRVPFGGYVVGYPLGVVFGRPIIGVLDTVGNVHDGIIFPEEVVRDSVQRYLGVIYPPRTYTLTPTLTLFNGRIRLSTGFDRETGFLLHDSYAENCVSSGLCLAPFLTTTPPLLQAKYASNGVYEDWLEPGDFTRWREVNVTVDIPQRFLRWDLLHVGFSRATVSLQGRNLALWTRYKGSDPESRDGVNGGFNNEANGTPQARAWSFRFDITP